jgi:hypothetical protein
MVSAFHAITDVPKDFAHFDKQMESKILQATLAQRCYSSAGLPPA